MSYVPFPVERPSPFGVRPDVKWAYEPVRAEDVPAAFLQGYQLALSEHAAVRDVQMLRMAMQIQLCAVAPGNK